MKVYVNENDIELLNDLFEATNSYECWAGNRGDDLEIVSLADHDKQVRKEAITEVRDLLEKKVPNGLYLSRAVLKKELDQIQGETK